MDAAIKVGVVIAVLVTVWALSDWNTHRRRALRVAQVLHLRDPRPQQPTGRPIEEIAADLRRIRHEIEHAPRGMPVARRRGWLGAYDDVLVAACVALDLEQALDALPEGPRRDLERERIERLLTRAGLVLTS